MRAAAIQVGISVSPRPEQLMEPLASRFRALTDQAQIALVEGLTSEVLNAFTAATSNVARMDSEMSSLRTSNADLLTKHAANDELESATKEIDKLSALLKQIEGKEDHLAALEKKQAELVVAIQDALSRRSGMFDSVKAEFEREPKIFDQMSFRIEFQYNNDQIAAQSTAFNRSKVGFLVQSRGSDIDIVRAMSDPKGFLEAIWTGKQELNRGKSKEEAAIGVLLTAPEIRFGAELDSDVIGGFGTSTMTPGKQALFALILILSEFQEPWPLLIDQPEDDLDSRSIFETIVPYLAKNKRDRQFIMVSNDANLVIGADSEQVIVANRHATDSPNRDDLTFEYLSGSLEHSQELNSTSPTMLGRFGIREHACEILDGGETAFQKRKEKYKI